MAQNKRQRKPLSATDRRRQAGHKHPRSVSSTEGTGEGKRLANLFTDRRKSTGEGKRAY